MYLHSNIAILSIYVKLSGGYTVTPPRFKVASEIAHGKSPSSQG